MQTRQNKILNIKKKKKKKIVYQMFYIPSIQRKKSLNKDSPASQRLLSYSQPLDRKHTFSKGVPVSLCKSSSSKPVSASGTERLSLYTSRRCPLHGPTTCGPVVRPTKNTAPTAAMFHRLNGLLLRGGRHRKTGQGVLGGGGTLQMQTFFIIFYVMVVFLLYFVYSKLKIQWYYVSYLIRI